MNARNKGVMIPNPELEGQSARTASYRVRQQEKGLKMIQVWIPEQDEEAIRKYIERKRKKYLAALKALRSPRSRGLRS